MTSYERTGWFVHLHTSHLDSSQRFLSTWGVVSLEKKKKRSHKKFSKRKQAHVGIEPSTSQTRWEWHHNTFMPSLHLVAFCQLSIPQNDIMHIGIFTPTTLSTAYSTAFSIQDNPYVPCPATKVHNIIHTPTCYTNSALLMHSTASTYKTDHICHAQ